MTTLNEWALDWPYKVEQHSSGAYVTPDEVHPHRSRAWHLSDYAVSSVTGGSIWFVPRTSRTCTRGAR